MDPNAAAAPPGTPPRRPLRRRLAEDLGGLAALLLGYLILAYLLLPAWWRHHERNAILRQAPKVTRTAAGIPGDPLNVALVGREADLVQAFSAAGRYPADPTTFRTGLHIARSVVLRRPYPEAPVSDLYLWGRRQDLAFERPVGKSPRERRHVRFWRSARLDADGRPLWLGAATLDVRVGLSYRTGQVTHHISPGVDAERDQLVSDLRQAGRLVEVNYLPGMGPTRAAVLVSPWGSRSTTGSTGRRDERSGGGRPAPVPPVRTGPGAGREVV